MKLFFTIISTILLVQVAIAGPVRFKRADAFVDFMELTVKILKEIVPLSEKSVKNAIDKMPKTEAYAKYRDNLVSYLEDIHAKKDNADICFTKSVEVIETFIVITAAFSKEDAPKEAQELYKLIDTDEDTTLKADIDEWKIRFTDLVMEYGSKHRHDENVLTDEYAQKVLTLATDVCQLS